MNERVEHIFDVKIPPPPMRRSKLRARSVTIVLLAVATVVLVGRSFITDPNEELAKILPSRIEDTFGREGIDLRVETVSCEDLPAETSVFTLTCDVGMVEISERIEVIVQGSVSGTSVEVDELFSRERLVTEQQAIDYVQRLVDDLDSTKRVRNCDLGGPLGLIRSGREFSCLLDSSTQLIITVAGNGSGSISGLESLD